MGRMMDGGRRRMGKAPPTPIHMPAPSGRVGTDAQSSTVVERRVPIGVATMGTLRFAHPTHWIFGPAGPSAVPPGARRGAPPG